MNSQIKQRIEQLNNGEIPDGYKKTDFGIFPYDWEVTNIGKICNVYSGGTPSTSKSEYWNGDIPWCSPTDITKSEKYIVKTDKYISKEGLDNSSAVLMPVNSILMCSRATIGPKCINKVPMATNQGFKNLVCKRPKDTEYVYYLLDNLVLRFIKASNGSTFLELSKSELEKARCCIPKTEYERTRIAEILMKWDKAIELYDKQIDQLKRYKSICLKKMFPQKGQSVPEWRFPQFTEAWEQRKLGEIFEYERPDAYIVSSDKYSDTYSTPVLTANKGFILGYTNEHRTCSKECVIFDDFTLESKYVTFPFMVKSSAIKILSAKNGYYLPFAYELLQTTKIEILGHARHYISVVQPTNVFVPSVEEQKKIGECIQSLDDLITLHQRKVESIKKQREVLQQYLLNGIVRV